MVLVSYSSWLKFSIIKGFSATGMVRCMSRSTKTAALLEREYTTKAGCKLNNLLSGLCIIKFRKPFENCIRNLEGRYPHFSGKVIEKTPELAFYQEGKALCALSPEWRNCIGTKYETEEDYDHIDDL